MSCTNFFGPTGGRFNVMSTTEIFFPMTDWGIALGIDKVRATLRLLAESGDIQIRLAYQTATTVINEGGAGGRSAPQGLGTPTNPTMSTLQFNVAPGTVHWIRWGVLVSLSQAGAPGQADVVLSLATPACGKPLGRFSDQIHIGGNTSPAVIPVTEWFAAFLLADVELALVGQAVSGNLETQVMFQTADVDAASPNAWQALGTAASGARKDNLRYDVSSITDPGVGTKPMLGRVGLAYKLGSGTSEAYASVAIDLAARRG
jgi:hypothetical protein